MGEVVWVDGWVGGGIGGGDVHASAGERVFEDGEEGKVVPWVEGRIWSEEGAGVGGVFGGECAGKVDFLEGGFGGGEEFAESEGILFGGGEICMIEDRGWNGSYRVR